MTPKPKKDYHPKPDRMEVLNFTEKKILPSLLDKSKTQTIRKAWEITNDEKLFKYKLKEAKPIPILQDKPARFKIGEKVKVVWNYEKYPFMCICDPLNKNGLSNKCLQEHGHNIFSTDIGVVGMTEVFKITMGLGNAKGNLPVPYYDFEDGSRAYVNVVDKLNLSPELDKINNAKNLFRRDGFKSGREMFKTIDDLYGLSEPKDFHGYRWVWK